MKPNKNKRGQFVIIAIMLTAIMIVSIGAIMHNAITYYKHEPWEEYTTLIGDVEINTQKVVQFCLASYTHSNEADLNESLTKWQKDLEVIYPSSGIRLTSSGYTMSKGWNPTAEVSVFKLSIASIGLEGYTFSVKTSLSLEASRDTSETGYTIAAVIRDENLNPITGLKTTNFQINGTEPKAVAPYYDKSETLIYRILPQQDSFPAEVKVTDNRGICAVDYVA